QPSVLSNTNGRRLYTNATCSSPCRSASPSFFANDPAGGEIFTLALHDALPISINERCKVPRDCAELALLVGEYHTHSHRAIELRSEEHTSELQSREKLVCRLLLEKKNNPILHLNQ